LVAILKDWVTAICVLLVSVDENNERSFTPRDTFVGFADEETISSLVYCQHGSTFEDLLHSAKRKLLQLTSFAGIIRIFKSRAFADDQVEMSKLCNEVLADRRKVSLRCFITDLQNQDVSTQSIITTYSQHFNVLSLEPYFPQLKTIQLSTFGSERAFTNFIKEFFSSLDLSVLVLQCESKEDVDNLLLIKSIVEKIRRQFENSSNSLMKHVVILISAKQELYEEDQQLNMYYSTHWDNLHMDKVDQDEQSWDHLVALFQNCQSFYDYLQSGPDLVCSVYSQSIMSYIDKLKHKLSSESVQIENLCENLTENPVLRDIVSRKIILYFKDLSSDEQYRNWLFDIACSQKYTSFSPSFDSAIERYLRVQIEFPATMAIYILEKYSATSSYASGSELVQAEEIKNIFLCHPSLQLETKLWSEVSDIDYSLPSLSFPFSLVLYQNYASLKGAFLDELNSRSDLPVSLIKEIYKLKLEVITEQFFFDSKMASENVSRYSSFLVDDLIRIHTFRNSHSDLDRAVAATKQIVSGTYTYSESTSPEWWQLTLWHSYCLFGAIELMLYPKEVILSTKTNEELNSYAANIGIDLENTTNFERIVLQQVIIDFCKHSSPFQLQAFQGIINSQSLQDWCTNIKPYYHLILQLCSENGLNYLAFDYNYEYLSNLLLFKDLAMHVVAIRVMMYLCDFIQESCMELVNPIITQNFKESELKADLNLLRQIVRFFDDARQSGICDESRITYYYFMILQSFEFIGTMDAASRNITPDIVLTFGSEVPDQNIMNQFLLKFGQEFICSEYANHLFKQLCKYSNNVPIGASSLINFLIGRLAEMIIDEEQSVFMNPYESLRDFAAFTEQHPNISRFNDLLGESTKNSPLEIVLTDVFYIKMTGMLNLNDDEFDCYTDSFRETFITLIHTWQNSFDEVSSVNRIYGAAFLRWFIKQLHKKALDPENMHEDLFKLLSDTIGMHNQHNINHIISIIFLKEYGKSLHELKYACSDGGSIRNVFEWVATYDLGENDVMTKLTPVPIIYDVLLGNVLKSWDLLYDPLAPSDQELKNLVWSRPVNIVDAIVAATFMRRCRHQAVTTSTQDGQALLEAVKDSFDDNSLLIISTVFHRFPGLHIGDATIDDICLLLVVSSVITYCPNNDHDHDLLGLYLHDASFLKSSYVLAAHSSGNSKFGLDDSSERVCLRCGCGFVFIIDNNRQSTMRRSCSRCGNNIYDTSQVITSNSEPPDILNQTGCVFSEDPSPRFSERSMTPSEYRIMVLVVHACIIAGLTMHPEEFSQSLFPGLDIEMALAQSWRQMHKSWEVLVLRLENNNNTGKERLCAFMMSVIDKLRVRSFRGDLSPLPMTFESRMEVEKLICCVGNYSIRSLLDNYGRVGQKAIFKHSEPDSLSPFDKAILEVEPIQDHYLARYLRTIKQPCFEELHRSFEERSSNSESYPILCAFFEFENQLQR
jgi:hypothetical protein